jgi:hypothetical protein
MPDSDIQRGKEEISRQQYWYATTTLAFMALLANVVKPATSVELWICALMIGLSMCAGVHMVIVCHKEYALRNNLKMGWWRALGHALTERRAALFCTALIVIEGVGLITLFAIRLRCIGCSRY